MDDRGQPRPTCRTCLRPAVVCWCDRLVRVETRTRVVIVQHPSERRKAIGTGRMAAACLVGAETVVTKGFGERDPRLVRLLSDPDRPAWLLFPGTAAADADQAPPAGPITLVAVDATWSHAVPMVHRNPLLAALPRIAFRPDAPSGYRIRRQPRGECMSTIEALAHVLGVLEGDPAGMARLLEPFRALIDRQIALRDRRYEPRYPVRKLARRAARG
ncbi:MAG: DTW domain-containing protein [Deltaproteobacteria bacterium]|nr:DTW domain-containing protein [Deltaproteobacteria bacterium]